MTWEQWKDFQILKGRKVLAEMASKDLQNIFNTLNWSHSVETKLQGLLIAKVSRTKYFFHAFFFFWRTAGWYESWKNKKKWYPFRKWTLVNYQDANQLDVWCSRRLNEMMRAERENTLWSTLFDDMLSSLVNVWKRVSIVLQDRPKTLTIEIRICDPPPQTLLLSANYFSAVFAWGRVLTWRANW